MGKQKGNNPHIAQSYDDAFEAYKNVINPNIKKYGIATVGKEASSELKGYKSGIGESDYDKTLNWNADIDEEDIEGSVNEYRSQEQGLLPTVGAGLGRVVSKVIREVGKTAGALGGLGVALIENTDDLISGEDKHDFLQTTFDNAFIKGTDKIFDNANKSLLPVYVSDAVENGNFMDKVTSSEFWTTEGADGVGYMISAFAPGAALKALGASNKLFGAAAKLTALRYGKSLEVARRGLAMAGVTANKIDSFIIPAANTFFEAGAESKGVGDDIEQRKPEAKIEFFKNLDVSSKEFQNKMLTKGHQLDLDLRAGKISIDEYNQLGSNLQNAVAEELFENNFKEQKSYAMRNTFLTNLAILAGPNYIQAKLLFGQNESKNLLKQLVNNPSKNVIKQASKRVGESFLSEGSEEVAQTSTEHRQTNKAISGKLHGGLDALKDISPGEFSKDFIKTLGTTEGQVAGFLGGFLGSGVSIVTGYRQDKRDVTENNRLLDKIKNAGTSLNDINLDSFEKETVKNEKGEDIEVFKKDEKGNKILNIENVQRIKKALNYHEALSEIYDNAIEEGDVETIQKVKKLAEHDLIMNFVGEDELTIDALKEHLKEILPTETEDKFKSKENQNRQHDIIEKAKYLQKELVSFQNMSTSIIKLENEKATPEQVKSFMGDLQNEFLKETSLLYELRKEKQELVKDKAKLESETSLQEIDNPNFNEDLSHEFDKKVISRVENPRLKTVTDKLTDLNKDIKDKESFLNYGIWNTKIVNGAFNWQINESDRIKKATSEENIQKVDEVANLLNEKLSETDEFGENKLTQEDYEALLNNEVLSEETKSVVNDTEETQKTSNTKKENTKKVEDPRIKELNKKIFLLENLNKKVILNGNIKGTLLKINDERYELHDDNFIHEININDIDSFKLDTSDSKYNINNITEDSVTVNGVEYIINTDSKGNIVSLSPVNKPSQEIKNEKLITAVEIKRNQLEYKENIENIEEVIEKLENNYSNLNAILDTIWETNMTNTVAEALDNLYEDKTLTKSEELQLSLWLIDAFKRVTRLYNEKNTKEETETLNQAYSNLETIESLLYNLKINKNETVQKERSDSKNEIIISSEKTKTKSSETNNEEIELLKKEKEDLIKQLEEEKVENIRKNRIISEETEAAIRELHKEKVEQLPTQAEKETKRDLNRSEQEGVNEKDIIEDDSIYKEEDRNVSNSFTNIEVITPKLENNSLGHKIQNFFNNFVNFEKQPRDKTKDKVTFSLGDFINNDTVKDIWDNFLKTGKIDKAGIKWLEEYLPIKVTLTNGKEEGSSFLKSKKGSPNFESYELPLRKAIVKALIENKGDFTKFEGSVQGQGKGKLNLDNSSTQNNVLNISTLKGLSKSELLKYLKENTYIVNHDKQLVHAKTGQKSVESFFNVIKSFHSGDVFLVFTRPNGQKVPIKLNNKRISEEKAGATVKLLSLLSNVIRTNQSDVILSDKDFKEFLKEKIGEESYNQLESEINLSNKNNNNERLREILEYITYSQNNSEITKLFVDNQGNLTVGRLLQKVNEDLQGEGSINYDMNLSSIGFTGFAGQNIDALINNELDTNEQARFNHLVNFIRYKKSNIIANKFTDNNYIEYVFGIDNKESLVSTNVSVDQDIFGGYSDIFLNNEITTLEDDKAKAKELKEIENTEIPLSKEVVYEAPRSEIEVKESEIEKNENNSENTRIIQENFVSLSKMDKITNIRDKNKMIEFAKENLDFIPKSLKTSENFQQLKQEYPNSEALNKQVDKICGL